MSLAFIASLALATPPAAPKPTPEQALAAVRAAIAQAPRKIARLNKTPIEFAALAIVESYGDELAGRKFDSPDAFLEAKAAFWAEVEDALASGQRSALADGADNTLTGANAAAKESGRYAAARRAARMIRDDIDGDMALVRDAYARGRISTAMSQERLGDRIKLHVELSAYRLP